MGQEEMRKEVLEEYFMGGVSLRGLAKKYGVNFRKIHRWVKEARGLEASGQTEGQRQGSGLKLKQSKELPEDVQRLQKELEEARLYNELLNAMIDIAEEQMGINIRKKPGAKRR